LNLDILPELGANAAEALAAYDLILSPKETLVGEWLFARPEDGRDDRCKAHLLDKGFEPEAVTRVCSLRPRLDAWIDRWARRVVGGGHDIVGVSCSFGRTRASVRLAQAIRALAPGTRVIAGGFSATGDMGLAMLEAFDAFDLVCHTEGEEVIGPIVQALRGRPGASLEAIRGVSYRIDGGIVTQMGGATLAELEATPLPDYDDYFEEVETLRASWDPALSLPAALPLETVRGCWWGARTPCTFCSLNGDRIAFRSKSRARVLQEIDRLHAEHGATSFAVVDNVLSETFFDTLLPELARQRPRKAFSWEVRPNLRRDQAAALMRAGVTHAQPGIESLSTPALRLMRKGTSAIENVQALKWLSAYRIRCSWNFLFSLPGERVEWYEEVERLIPRLLHLPAPTGLHRVSLQRFSPLFVKASEERVKVIGPTAFTRLVFDDLPGDLVDRLSYDFDYEIEGRPPGLDTRIRDVLEPPLRTWRESHATKGCTLSLVNGPGESLLVIGPVFQPERLLRVRGLLRRFLRRCESIWPERRLLQSLADATPDEEGPEPPLDATAYRRLARELSSFGVQPEDLPAVDLPDVIRYADERGWVYREAGRILALPVDQTHLVKSGAFLFDAALRRSPQTR